MLTETDSKTMAFVNLFAVLGTLETCASWFRKQENS